MALDPGARLGPYEITALSAEAKSARGYVTRTAMRCRRGRLNALGSAPCAVDEAD